MKNLLLVITAFFFFQANSSAQTVIELDGIQSMAITGKGQGQDGAINPYMDSNSFAIIENIGKNAFSIRIQKENKIIKEIEIKPKETKKITLLKGYEMYFDSESKSKAKVAFEKAPAY